MSTCVTCRWWGGKIRGQTYTLGPCNRYPPIPVMEEGRIRNILPIMAPADFCGEYTLKNKPESESE